MATNEIRHRAHLVKSYGEVPFVEANESRLGQVFLNLIVNAAQAIPEGSADSNRDPHHHPAGPLGSGGRGGAGHRAGHSARRVKRLFTPFFTTKRPGGRTGLGLPFATDREQLIGGEIEVESQVGGHRLQGPPQPGAVRRGGDRRPPR